MKITILHQYFKHPREGGAIRSYYLAQGLLRNEVDVEVITAHNEPSFEIKRIDGIKVFYLPVYYDNSLTKYQRIRSFVNFVLQAIVLLYKLKKPNYLYVISTPLTVGIVALIMRLTRRVRYIFEIGDLWPEAPIQLGYIKNRIVKKVLYFFEGIIYKYAYRIVAMSPDIEKIVNKNHKTIMIPNMSDCSFFEIIESKNEQILNRYDLKDEFIIAYLGAAGRANHLEYLLNAAKAIEDQKLNVKIIIAAAGSELEHFRSEVLQSEVENVIFENYTNKEGVKELLSISDAVYVSFSNVPILSSGSPNKFFDGLAAGKLIIINFAGWIKDEIKEAQCGFSYDPNQLNDLLDKLTSFVNDRELLHKAQANSRKLAESKFSREKLIKRWLTLFD